MAASNADESASSETPKTLSDLPTPLYCVIQSKTGCIQDALNWAATCKPIYGACRADYTIACAACAHPLATPTAVITQHKDLILRRELHGTVIKEVLPDACSTASPASNAREITSGTLVPYNVCVMVSRTWMVCKGCGLHLGIHVTELNRVYRPGGRGRSADLYALKVCRYNKVFLHAANFSLYCHYSSTM